MRASIVIISYNGAGYLHRCIEAVVAEMEEQDQIIVVDNASQDGSAELVESQFPQVKVQRNQVNMGFAEACNQGAKMARGEWLVFLNQDTCVQAGWLEGLLRGLEKDPAIGLVTSKLVMMRQPEMMQMCGQEVHFTGFTFGRGYGSAAEGYGKAEAVGAVSGASFAIRRGLWERLGGFDPQLFMYYEETDLSWRARLVGYKSFFCPDSVVLHDYSESEPLLAYKYSERNRVVLLLKSWKWVTLLLLLPSLGLAEVIDWGYMALVGWSGLRAKLNGLGWLVRNLPRVLHERAKVQAARKEPDWVALRACTARLSPRRHTGGWIGSTFIAVCNIWFGLHYRFVLILAQEFDI